MGSSAGVMTNLQAVRQCSLLLSLAGSACCSVLGGGGLCIGQQIWTESAPAASWLHTALWIAILPTRPLARWQPPPSSFTPSGPVQSGKGPDTLRHHGFFSTMCAHLVTATRQVTFTASADKILTLPALRSRPPVCKTDPL